MIMIITHYTSHWRLKIPLSIMSMHHGTLTGAVINPYAKPPLPLAARESNDTPNNVAITSVVTDLNMGIISIENVNTCRATNQTPCEPASNDSVTHWCVCKVLSRNKVKTFGCNYFNQKCKHMRDRLNHL